MAWPVRVSPEAREAILRRRAKGRSYAVIGEDLGFSPGTVRAVVRAAWAAGDNRAAPFDAAKIERAKREANARRFGGVIPPAEMRQYRKLRWRVGYSRKEALAAVTQGARP